MKARKFAVCGAVIAYLLSIGFYHATGQGPLSLLKTGKFHGLEVQAATGETWYGLFAVKENFELMDTKITVEMINDPVVDGTNEKTGKKVSIDLPKEPLFLVKGLSNPREGKITTVFSGERFIYPAENISFKLGPRNYYNLSAYGEVIDKDINTQIKNYTIKFWTNQKKQIIAKFSNVFIEGAPLLLWAGDLDRDGQLDLLMDLRNNYNVHDYALFLSSLSRKGKLVEKSATFRITGG